MHKKNILLLATLLIFIPLYGLGQETVRIIFAGDIVFSPQEMKGSTQSNGSGDYAHYLRFVKAYIEGADLAVANFEVDKANKSSQPSSPEALLIAAKEVGFDILNTTNNDGIGKEKANIERTLQILDQQKMLHVGAYRDLNEREHNYPLMVERNGIKIAFLSYTCGTHGQKGSNNLTDTVQMKSDLQKARCNKADYVITLIHWGAKKQSHSDLEQEQLAQWLLHNGSDIVVGGSQMAQNVSMDSLPNNEAYPQMVVYSLGKLLSNKSDKNSEGGFMVEIEIEKQHNKTIHNDTTLLRSCAYMPYCVNKGNLEGRSGDYLVPSSDALAYPESYQIPSDNIAALRSFSQNIREQMIQSVCTDTLRFKDYATLGDIFPERYFYHNGKPATPKRYTYYSYDYDTDHRDTAQTYVYSYAQQFCISSQEAQGQLVPGRATTYTYVDCGHDIIVNHLHYADHNDLYWMFAPYHNPNLYEWDTIVEAPTLTRYVTSVNSNRIEVLMNTATDDEVIPLPYLRYLPGVMQKMIRNGQVQMELASDTFKPQKERDVPLVAIPLYKGRFTTPVEATRIEKERLVITTNVFDSVQLHWGENTNHTDAPWHVSNPGKAFKEFPFDTVIHLAGGTVALKRVHLPALPAHYQLFAELHQRSNGDAYDRTGSIFIIPHNCVRTFFAGLYQHPDSLPIIRGRDGERYQGIAATSDYLPPVELMRFFTPFGVHHFNNRMQLDGITWADEAYYKQEVTDLAPCLQGDVWIGAFIGNYDAGGHIITLDLKAYPGEETWSDTTQHITVLPLINTCNVLEMAGQNYGKIFGTDSLTVKFFVKKKKKKIRLRYLTTGHGGWGGGDEFNPKENAIFIDGQKRFCYTPWRCDCGTYREKNPVSGNFWNGLSSSDYSRSGWCPGTATQPTYFDLSNLSPGEHTFTVAIPQGAPMEGSFSAWNISATLLIEQ